MVIMQGILAGYHTKQLVVVVRGIWWLSYEGYLVILQKYCGYHTRSAMSLSYKEYVVVIMQGMMEVIRQDINCQIDIVSSLLLEVFLAQLKLNHKQLNVHNNP